MTNFSLKNEYFFDTAHKIKSVAWLVITMDKLDAIKPAQTLIIPQTAFKVIMFPDDQATNAMAVQSALISALIQTGTLK